MDSVVEDMLVRISDLESRGADMPPSEARRLLVQLSETYTPDQIKEWAATAKGQTTPTRGRGSASKQAKPQRQRA